MTESTLPAPEYPPAPPSATDTLGFDRGTGTGEPNEHTARLLRLMKSADDGYNARDYDFFLNERHVDDVVVRRFGETDISGLDAHRAEMQIMITGFPDLEVHNDPYDIQFGQGDWTVALGKLSGTFTRNLELPDGTVVPPTGGSFETLFITIARWAGDKMAEEYVLFNSDDIMKQAASTS